MTYIKSGLPQKLDAQFNVYHNASATIANDEAITYADEDTSFNKSFSLSRSGAQFTLPVDGSTYYLEASIVYWHTSYPTLNYNYAVTCWYDVTNSNYVGIQSNICSGFNISEGRSGNIVADETAKFATSGGVYELRLKTTSGMLTAVDTPSGSGYGYVNARCLIWRF